MRSGARHSRRKRNHSYPMMEWFRRRKHLFYSSLNFRCQQSTGSQAHRMRCARLRSHSTQKPFGGAIRSDVSSVDGMMCEELVCLVSETRKSINCSHFIAQPENESSRAIPTRCHDVALNGVPVIIEYSYIYFVQSDDVSVSSNFKVFVT